MHVVLLCATRRGHRVLQKLIDWLPRADFSVFSFREEPWEPPFLDDIRILTESVGGQFYETKQVGSARWSTFWESTPVDLLFAVNWRYLLPSNVYQRPRLGSYAFHDSLLPEYRGFSPTVWAMINGEDHTGATLFEIADEVDTGDIVDQELVPIGPHDTIAHVVERTTEAYLLVLERSLDSLVTGTFVRRPQDHARATYVPKRLPEDNRIDWHSSSQEIYNLIRAVSSPYPGAYTYLDGKLVRVWSAAPVKSARRYVGRIPGRVVEVHPREGAVVLTGDGAILITEVQREGGEIVAATNVLNSLSQTLGA